MIAGFPPRAELQILSNVTAQILIYHAGGALLEGFFSCHNNTLSRFILCCGIIFIMS